MVYRFVTKEESGISIFPPINIDDKLYRKSLKLILKLLRNMEIFNEKILALCGSRNLESKGLEFLQEIKSYFNKKSDLKFEIITPNDYKLNPVSIGSKFFNWKR